MTARARVGRSVVLATGIAVALGTACGGHGGGSVPRVTGPPAIALEPASDVVPAPGCQAPPFAVARGWATRPDGAVDLVVRVTPTVDARALDVVARLPVGAVVRTGDASLRVSTPLAGRSYDLRVTAVLPPVASPEVPIDVTLDVSDGFRAGACVVVRDPAAPPPALPEVPGEVTSGPGHPVKVAGEMERAR